MGLRSIFTKEKDIKPPTTRQRINRDAVSALYWIITASIGGIVVLSALGLTYRYWATQASNEIQAMNTTTDEAMSILGNIASAAIGGLVGWLTREYAVSRRTVEREVQDLEEQLEAYKRKDPDNPAD